MRRLPLAFFALLGGASLLGLGIAWLINVTLFGRPHGALLEILAETAAAGIDCEHPGASPLFQKSKDIGPHAASLHLVLVDGEGHHLGERGHFPPGPPGGLPDTWAPWRNDNPLRSGPLWVSVPHVCQQNWTLWAWDPSNTIYRRLLLPRQIILVVSCSGSIILAVLLAFLFIRYKGREARRVLTAISSGQWGSRVPQRVWEPQLQLIHEFNRMAAAVEDSFMRLRSMEERRARLLSELAHDIRTPLASLRAAAETLHEFQGRMPAAQAHSLLETLMLDTDYFQSLIDDLLILAQIDRIDAPPPQGRCDLLRLLPGLWQRMQEQYPALSTHCVWPQPRPHAIWIAGDEALLRRLLQNTLDNAFQYAKTEVSCTLALDETQLHLCMANDAEPVALEDLHSWGHKRRQRIITEKAGQPHTSLGLGSSIIVGVARYLGGTATIHQSPKGAESLSQVSVIIDLPWFTSAD